MEHNTNRILWTVLSLAIGVSLYVGFHPAIDGQAQAVVHTIADKLSDSSGTADPNDSSDFVYSDPNTNDDTISINGYKGNKADVTIPTYHKIGSVNYRVTSIRSEAFYNDTSLEQVTIPGSVTSIGNDAFGSDHNLKSLTLGSGVTSIGSFAFANTALTSVDIPDSVTSISGYAFGFDHNLKSLTLGSGVTSIGQGTFANTALTSVDIPDSVTSIGNAAFGSDSNLKSLTLGSGVTSIGSFAFNCTALTSVDFPASLTSIGANAFYQTPISAISFKSPVALNARVFRSANLTNVTLPTGSTYNTDSNNSTFDSNVTVTIK